MEANDGNGNDLPGQTPAAADPASEKPETTDKPAGTADKGEGAEGDGKPADKDAKPGMSDTEHQLLRDTMKFKQRTKDLEDQLSKITGVLGDMKPEDVAALIAERKEADRIAMEKRGEYDRILEQVKTESQREKQSLMDEIASLRAALAEKDGAVNEMTVGRAFAESAYIREKSLIPASIARKEFGDYVDLVDGTVVVYDKPRGAADRTPLVDAEGKFRKFDDAIGVLYASHPDSAALLRAQGKPGAASSNVDTGKKPEPAKQVASGVGRISHALTKMSQNQ